MRLLWITCSLLAGAVMVMGAAAEDKGKAERKRLDANLAEVRAALDGREDVWTRWKECPADIFKQDQGLSSKVGAPQAYAFAECEADPMQCMRACFDGRNENACFQLARVQQDNTDIELSRYVQAMFAKACAAGQDGGCTNRAAGMLNGRYPDDPFREQDDAPSCIHRSFEVSCEADDAWGCTMLGWQYSSGSAIPVDHAKARAAFEKSCAISPDFVACEYARAELKRLP